MDCDALFAAIDEMRAKRQRNRMIPIDEVLVRRKCTPSVAERIRKLNGDFIEEGSIIRGLFKKPVSWRRAKIRAECGKATFHHRIPGGDVWETWRRDVHPAIQMIGERYGARQLR